MKALATERLFADTLIDDQISLEQQAIRDGIADYRRAVQDAIERGEGASTKAAERMLLYWCDPLVRAIRETQHKLKDDNITGDGVMVWGPPLLMIDAEQAAVVTMQVAMSKLLATYRTTARQLYYAIGSTCLSHLLAVSLKKADKEAWRAMFRDREKISPNLVRWWSRKNLDELYWDQVASIQLGSILYALLVNNAHCDKPDRPFKPAFAIERVAERDWAGRPKTKLLCRMTPAGVAMVNDGHRARQALRPRYLPMLMPPYKWSNEEQGGYISIRTPLVSNITRTHKDAIKSADLSEFFDCFHAAQASPWRANRRIVELVQAARESKNTIFNIPPENDPEPPTRPAGFLANATTREGKWDAVDPEQRRTYRRAVRDYLAQCRRNRADREVLLTRLGVLDMLGKYDKFWLPHQLDFRSRISPLPAHLHHQTSDMTRAMLECGRGVDSSDAESKRWIAIHAANCWKRGGVDKLPFDERVQWVMDHVKQVAMSAADPLDFTWWTGAKKPWQFLAACIAMMDDEAAAHLPVHLDGTCNGLQWYAALSRDEASAKSVNIVPSERPESVYAVVTDEFKRLVEADLTSDEMFRQRGESLKVASLAREVLPYCTLDTCKTPTMTTVYGVTLVGMIEQVRVSMIEQGMDRDTATRTKQYATTRVRGAIAKAASGANDTMAWLRECARIIVQGSRQPVAWTTPLGWPVIQPYRKLVRKNIKTITGTLEWYYPDPEAPPALKKQVDGVAANFIHSLDATHMMMTARRCRDENIWFGPVHDSYWTHASMCGRLGSVLREEFVYINGLDPLNRLAAEWAERYPGLDLPPPPPQGSLNLEVVMDSPYFFS